MINNKQGEKILYSIVFSLISVFSFSQNIDIHSTPENLVNAMIKAIKTKDNCVLRDLCDPLGESTKGDALPICGMQYLDAKQQSEISSYFGKAYINGYVTYETINGVSYAKVPIIFGPNVDKNETIELVNRNGKWFFLDF